MSESYYTHGFELRQIAKGLCAVHNTNDGAHVRTFKSKEQAEHWIADTLREPLTSAQAAHLLLQKIKQFEDIWTRTPATFRGCPVMADMLNRMRNLAAECQRHLHRS